MNSIIQNKIEKKIKGINKDLKELYSILDKLPYESDLFLDDTREEITGIIGYHVHLTLKLSQEFIVVFN